MVWWWWGGRGVKTERGREGGTIGQCLLVQRAGNVIVSDAEVIVADELR